MSRLTDLQDKYSEPIVTILPPNPQYLADWEREIWASLSTHPSVGNPNLPRVAPSMDPEPWVNARTGMRRRICAGEEHGHCYFRPRAQYWQLRASYPSWNDSL